MREVEVRNVSLDAIFLLLSAVGGCRDFGGEGEITCLILLTQKKKL